MLNHNFSKVTKSDHAFLPEGIQIEDLTQPCLVSQLALLAELMICVLLK